MDKSKNGRWLWGLLAILLLVGLVSIGRQVFSAMEYKQKERFRSNLDYREENRFSISPSLGIFRFGCGTQAKVNFVFSSTSLLFAPSQENGDFSFLVEHDNPRFEVVVNEGPPENAHTMLYRGYLYGGGTWTAYQRLVLFLPPEEAALARKNLPPNDPCEK